MAITRGISLQETMEATDDEFWATLRDKMLLDNHSFPSENINIAVAIIAIIA